MRSRIRPLCIILVFIPFTINIPKGVTCENNLYYEFDVSQSIEEAQSLWHELDNNNPTMSYNISLDPYHKESEEVDFKKEQLRVHNLSFDFPFYGHLIHTVRVDWNGRIATPDYEGQFQDLSNLTSFITPYDDIISYGKNQTVTIHCFNNDTQLTVIWDVERRRHYDDTYHCTFRVTLYNTGHIVFVYKHCADLRYRINPIGLSAAYTMDNGKSHVYDHLEGPDMGNKYRTSWISIYFRPRPTCLNQKDYSSCLSHPSTSHLTCFWCPTANLCSTGEDWYHLVWVRNNCDKDSIKKSPVSSTTTQTLKPKTERSAPPTQPTLHTTLVVIVCSAFLLLIGCIGILVLLVRRMKPSDTLIETKTTQPADVVADTTNIANTTFVEATAEAVHTTQTQPVITAGVTKAQTVQVVQMTRWTKKVIITIETHTTPVSEDSCIMPIVKIEKQKTTTNQLALDDMDMAEYDIIPDIKWEFPRQSLSLGETLGEGAFGRVVKAEANGIMATGTVTTVAVKMLKEDHLDSEMIALVSEMELMKMLGRHVNILNLLGVCSQHGPLYVIVEFATHYDLKQFLRKHRPSPEYSNVLLSDSHQVNLSEEVLVSFAHQVANGMKYLHSRKCLHRDLAARNVLVCHNYILKIADFGLARDVQAKEYYRVGSQPLLPYKWMAPESLSHRLFKYESDVWSYGVLVWEIMTFGESPYPSICDSEIMLSFLRSGHRLEKPSHCSDEIYDMMQDCWKHVASDRPQFSQLVSMLEYKLTNDWLNIYELWVGVV